MSSSRTEPQSLNCLVYRDRLLPVSEHNFIRNQYAHFSRMKPFYVGRYWDNPPDFLQPRYFIGPRGPFGFFKRRRFKKTGSGGEKILSKEKPDLIHAQFATSGAIVLPFAQRHKLPLVVTCHGADVYKKIHDKDVQKSHLGQNFQALADYASLFIAVTPEMTHRLEELGIKREKIKTIPIGVPDHGVAHTQQEPSLLIAGRFVEKKGHKILVEALKLLQDKKLEPKIIMAGDGPEYKTIEKLVKHYNLKNVHFTGWLDNTQLHATFNKVNAVVIPSIKGQNGDQEGWPTISKEAMMAGMPVIASSQTSIPTQNLIEAGGMEVPAGDAKALAMGIIDMLYEGRLYLPSRSMHARAFALTNLEDTLLSKKLENTLVDVVRHQQFASAT